ncbi:MAG TPA: dephospho-CoA kinase [Dehalococcoidia bacterium]|jgi:dephospho-CoA kinase|nr:dephospho-CoA kinase [Dehalococcoidia bacterium]|tara:strand:+ start:1172 stop:1801 length:630 start_codon:yes stop_codon:yes gene_type:complete
MNGVFMLVIGLTGGIGVGKSEVANVLSSFGVPIINADKEGHKTYKHGTIGWRRIVELFSSEILGEDGEVDRKKLAALVFNDSDARAWLNAAIHPLIREQVSNVIGFYEKVEKKKIVILDAALLYQANWHDLCDEVWLITANPVDLIYKRLAKRGLTSEEIKKRLDSQGDYEALIDRADVHIENSFSVRNLHKTVHSIWADKIQALQKED